jgi:hypothetical protein
MINLQLCHYRIGRNWKLFTELSNIDYTYAITFYNKVKQRQRDISITLLQDEIIKLNQLLPPEDELITIT